VNKGGSKKKGKEHKDRGSTGGGDKPGEGKEGGSGGLMGLFRRKKATQL